MPSRFSRRAFLVSLPAAALLLGYPGRLFGDVAFATGLTIGSVTDNRANYPDATIPTRELLEITFQVNGTVATNLQMPYDPSPPAGIAPGTGITVNAQFSPDNFQTIYTQPAFYYQDFTYEQINGSDWISPTNNYSWKVRWSPPSSGSWQYRLTAQDAGGSTTSAPVTFSATPSSNHGFIRVSRTDSRYFEFEDGTYFPGLGFNMNYSNVSWDNPIAQNQYNFGVMQANGIQLVRHWLSQWSIFGCQDNPWRSIVRGSDYDSQTTTSVTPPPGSDSAMYVIWSADTSIWQGSPAMALGLWKETPACKPNTSYHVKITYNIPVALQGPTIAGYPYGLVAKFGDWLQTPDLQTRPQDNWRSGQEVSYPATLANQVSPSVNEVVVTPYAYQATNGWATLEGDFTADSSTAQNGNNWLRNFYLTVENCPSAVGGGDASTFIDTVEIRENLGGGQYGPNLISKPWMSHLHYFDQKYSYAFDQVLGLAKQNGIYFKLVCLEKNDILENSFDFNGNPIPTGQNNTYFYGNGYTITKVRWLQQSFWRYLQARWGYSANIHSWELLNEGDPWNTAHYELANAFGQYMHQFAPNDHLVTTSNWNSFPNSQFWANSAYPYVDYADLHQYVLSGSDPTDFNDSAAATISVSNLYGAKTAGGAGKPIIRGETGFCDGTSTDAFTTQFASDTQGIWLHKFLWGQLNSGGMLECYWYDVPHIHDQVYSGNTYDHRPLYGLFAKFLGNLPLNNGHYQDLGATVGNALVRVVGQRDLVNGKAHLWIDNSTHTWNNVVNNPSLIAPQTGTVTFQLLPNATYDLQQYDTYGGATTSVGSLTTDGSGNLQISVTSLGTDTAYLVSPHEYSTSLPIQK